MWYLSAGGNLPSPLENHDGGDIQHNWTASHNPWPLWFIARVGNVDDSNCTFEMENVLTISTFQPQFGEATSDNLDATLPVLVNTKPLNKGDELRVHWVADTTKRSNITNPVTWASKAKDTIRRARGRPGKSRPQ